MPGTHRHHGRIDFHLHSRASNVTDYYATNSLALPESWSDPIDVYRLLKERGMKLFTLTDHNSIDGVKELLDAGLPDVFISAEMTAAFPEDGCNIHVTVANMSEEEFKEIDRLRPNVYEMVDYIDRAIANEANDPTERRMTYFMTHPLMSTQNRPYGREGALALSHIEKVLLLFNCFEVRNGTRGRALNSLTARLVASTTKEMIERLADKHGILPKGPTPWLKSVVGGSDDHSGINPGRTWTEFTYEGGHPKPNDLVDSIRRRETRAAGEHGGPLTLAHAVVKLFYDGQTRGAAGSNSVRMGSAANLLLGFAFESSADGTITKLLQSTRAWIEAVAGERWARIVGKDRPFEKILMTEAWRLFRDGEFRDRLSSASRTDDKIFLIIGTLMNRIVKIYVDRVREAHARGIVAMIRESVALLSSNILFSLPYSLSFLHQSSDRMLVRDVREAFDLSEEKRLCLVTDTLFEINGVARTIRRMMHEAQSRGVDLTVVTCLGATERDRRLADPEIAALVAAKRLKIFEAIVDFDLPEYEGLKLRVPPFLEVLRFVQEEGFGKMQISTPGTIGLVGLLAAKVLQIETASTYHTSFPEYVENYTRDVSLEALTWKYMIFFYQAVDETIVPSKFIARLLHKRGLRNRKLLVLDRWVDDRRFHPSFRTAGFWRRFGVEREDEIVKFVYVGRVGAEKGLDILARAFKELARRRSNIHLIVVGDGPFRATLEGLLAGEPATFTGFLEHEDLARAFASADVKVFPSTTDTWGNAPLEAQSSGIPVIVTDKGGPQELIDDGVTGFKVRGGDVSALLSAMQALLDPTLRAEMGRAAREFVERNRVQEPYTAILDSDAYRRRHRKLKMADHSDETETITTG